MNEKSAWAPFSHKAFRALWCAGAVVNLAIWMQTVGAAWVMTTLSPSPLMVSLVQTAMALPVFLFGLPGGVIADLVDRRHWLLFTQSLMLGAAVLLCLLSYSGLLQDWSLLLLTFMLGTGSALNMSAWMVTTVAVLPREQVPAAVSLSAISTNVARALGPALAGFLIAYSSSGSVFLVIALCFSGVLVFVFCWKPRQQPAGLPPETFFGGMRSGLRYIRHSSVLFDALKQVFVFTSCAGALWALLPLVAKGLGMGAGGYGLLMGCLGAGAVLAAVNLTALYGRFTLRQLIIAGVIAFTLATLAASLLHSRILVCAMLVLAGMAWMAVNATVSTVVQTCAADWVRARVASVYLLMYMGAMAIGGILWGAVAEWLGVGQCLLLSAVTIMLGLFVTRRADLELGQEADFATAQQTDKLMLADDIAHSDGPVCVEISYRVKAAELDDFLRIVYPVGRSRRRNGAQNWRLYRDLAAADHFIERFIVESWLDYLRQRERVTQGDKMREQGLVCFLDQQQTIRRYIYQGPADRF